MEGWNFDSGGLVGWWRPVGQRSRMLIEGLLVQVPGLTSQEVAKKKKSNNWICKPRWGATLLTARLTIPIINNQGERSKADRKDPHNFQRWNQSRIGSRILFVSVLSSSPPLQNATDSFPMACSCTYRRSADGIWRRREMSALFSLQKNFFFFWFVWVF